MRGYALVFHVAAVSDYWRTPAKRIYLVNVEGTRNVLAAELLAPAMSTSSLLRGAQIDGECSGFRQARRALTAEARPPAPELGLDKSHTFRYSNSSSPTLHSGGRGVTVPQCSDGA